MKENIEILSGHESLETNENLCPLLEKAKMVTFTQVLARYVLCAFIFYFHVACTLFQLAAMSFR